MIELTQEVFEKILSNAKAIARRYRRKCWWVPIDDIEQEAAKAQVEALKNYDPERGIELGAYLWYAGLYAARRLVHKLSAPVSHSHRVEKLRGLTRTTVMIETDEGTFDRPEMIEHTTPEKHTHRAMLTTRARSRVVALLGTSGAAFALGVLSGEYRATDVVAEHGGNVADVYDATLDIRRTLIADPVLYEIWKEI